MVKMPHWPIPLGNKQIDLELSRVKKLLEVLGNPQEKIAPVIHVAGTNGKGSTIAFLKSILNEAGYKVHAYTSPHLIRFNERINILGAEIEDNFLYQVIEKCRFAAEENNIYPTFFEATTVAAILAFSLIKADVVILEVGMGGRLDATNVIENPLCSIITSISYDHVEFLGDTLAKIAFEKAGIIKDNCPCVISGQYPEVNQILFQITSDKNSSSFAYEYDWNLAHDQSGNISYMSKDKNFLMPKLGLVGEHQYMNATTAVTALINLPYFKINDDQLSKGLQKAVWPARLQKLIEGEICKKIPENWEIWVDGAHNDAGAHILDNWLQYENKMPTYIIFGMTKGRNFISFIERFLNKTKLLVTMTIETEPSSYSGEYLAQETAKIGFTSHFAESLEEGLSFIIDNHKEGDARILVCGSLYLAGDILYKNQGFVRK